MLCCVRLSPRCAWRMQFRKMFVRSVGSRSPLGNHKVFLLLSSRWPRTHGPFWMVIAGAVPGHSPRLADGSLFLSRSAFVLMPFPSRLCSGLRSVRTWSGSASHRRAWRFGQPLGSDLASPWGGGLDSVSLLIEEYQTGGKSQYESIKKVGQKKDLPSQGYISIKCP